MEQKFVFQLRHIHTYNNVLARMLFIRSDKTNLLVLNLFYHIQQKLFFGNFEIIKFTFYLYGGFARFYIRSYNSRSLQQRNFFCFKLFY